MHTKLRQCFCSKLSWIEITKFRLILNVKSNKKTCIFVLSKQGKEKYLLKTIFYQYTWLMVKLLSPICYWLLRYNLILHTNQLSIKNCQSLPNHIWNFIFLFVANIKIVIQEYPLRFFFSGMGVIIRSKITWYLLV